MYNQDYHLCRICDDEPAVYRGLCATCLYDEKNEDHPDGRRLKPLHRRDRNREDQDYGD